MLQTLPPHILVEQARQGDKQAFESLFHETHARVYNFLLGMGLSMDEADDLCQETYIRAWSRLDSLRSSASFIAWLHQIARNAARDYLKHRGRRPETPVSQVSPDEAALQQASGRELEPEAAAEGHALSVAVREGIASLPESQRLPILMRHIEGMPVEEISKGLNISYGTALSRLARGRAALARKLAPFFSLPQAERGNANVVQD